MVLLAALADTAAQAAMVKGANVHCGNHPAVYQMLGEAGATWVRLDAYEHVLNEHGYLPVLDECVDAARAAGLHVLMVVTGDPAGIPDPEGYAAKLGQLAEHMRDRVRAYEIWNEPNSRAFYAGDAIDYATLLRAAAPAVRQADPQATIVAGSLARADTRWLKLFYRAGGRGLYDVFSVHPYEQNGAAAASVRGVERLRGFRRVMLAHGDRSPVWVTEIGWHGGARTTPARQALHLRRVAPVLASLRFVRMALWYQAWSGARDSDSLYALLEPDLSPRASWGEFTRWLGSPGVG
jgi:hypothetical protein